MSAEHGDFPDARAPREPEGAEEARLQELVARYIDSLIAGETLDFDEILREHPDLGEQVVEHLRSYVDIGADAEDGAPLGTLGDYTLRRQIGRGGMGVVYEAWENSIGRTVALKVLPAGLAADTRAAARFLREAQAAGRLNHPNVVSVYAMGVREQTPYYAMEYVEGETLAQVVAKLRTSEPNTPTPFGPSADDIGFYSAVARAFADAADGLQHAHAKGVVHRDIKPSNLILDHEGRLRILDFGLARLEGQESITVSGDLVGTVQYMSPEQAQVKKIGVDHRTDVYSLGATMYELLTLRPPFKGRDHHDTLTQIITRDAEPPHKLNARVPRDLETIVLKCLRKNPADRYGTAEALAQDLRRFSRGNTIEARPQSRWEILSTRVRRHRRLLVVSAVTVALVITCAVLAFSLSRAQKSADKYLALEYDRRLVHAAMKVFRSEMGLVPKRLGFAIPRSMERLVEERARGGVEEALSEIEGTIQSCPGRYEGYYFQGRALAWLGRKDAGIAALGEALTRRPGFLPASRLADNLRGAKRSAELDGAVAGDKWAVAWVRARESVDARQWNDTIAACSALIELEEGQESPYPGAIVEALLTRGMAEVSLGDYEGAKRDFWAAQTHAIARWGELIEPGLLVGRTLCLEGKPSAAEQIFEGMWNRATDKDEVALWVTMMFNSFHATESAVSWSRRVSDAELYVLLEVGLESQCGHFETAIRRRQTLLQRHPDSLDLWLDQGGDLLRLLWVRKGGRIVDDGSPEFQELAMTAIRAVEIDPNDPAALGFASLVARARGALDRACELTERAHRMTVGGHEPSATGEDDMGRSKGLLLVAMTMGVGASAQEARGAFTKVEPVSPEIYTPFMEVQAAASGDDLSLAFGSDRPGAQSVDIYITDRESTSEPFPTPRNVAELNSSAEDLPTFLSDDGLTLYFMSDKTGNFDMYVATRPSKQEPFGDIQILGWRNSFSHDGGLSVTSDGLEAYFVSQRPGGKGGRDIWMASRSSVNEPFANVRNVAEVNTPYEEAYPGISGDGLTLFWSDLTPARPGGQGALDLWYATRSNHEEPFGTAVNIGAPVNASGSDFWPRISSRWPADGSVLYFNRCWGCSGSDYDIYRAVWKVTPLFRRGDTNGDGVLDIADAVFVLAFLFAKGDAPECLDAADANDSGAIDIADAITVLGHLFANAGPLDPPFGECGADPTLDRLDCESHSPCQQRMAGR